MGISTAIAGVSAATGVYSAVNGANQTGQATQQAANASDPFASQRPMYQQQLAGLMAGQDGSLGNLQNLPGYQAGLQAVERGQAALGYLGSGNLATSLLDYGGNIFNQQAQLLATLSGATIGNPGAAGQAITQGNANQQNLIGQGIKGLQQGLGGLAAGMNNNQPNLNPSAPVNNFGSDTGTPDLSQIPDFSSF